MSHYPVFSVEELVTVPKKRLMKRLDRYGDDQAEYGEYMDSLDRAIMYAMDGMVSGRVQLRRGGVYVLAGDYRYSKRGWIPFLSGAPGK